jgi:hypothetical protein
MTSEKKYVRKYENDDLSFILKFIFGRFNIRGDICLIDKIIMIKTSIHQL